MDKKRLIPAATSVAIYLVLFFLLQGLGSSRADRQKE